MDVDAQQDNILVKLQKSLFSLAKNLNSIAGIILILMMFLAAADVILRYLFHRPIIGTMGLIEAMLPLITSLSFAYAESLKGHLKLDFITSRLPKKINSLLETSTDVLTLGIISFIAFAIFKYANHIKSIGLLVGDITIPVYPFVYIVALGWFLFALAKLANLVKSRKESGAQFWTGIVIGVVVLCFFALIPIIRESQFYLSPSMVGFIGVILLLILSFIGMSIGSAMLIVAFVGAMYIKGFPFALNISGVVPYSTASTYNFSVYPLFIYMGTICFVFGIGEDIFKTVHKWFGHITGGLAIASVIGSAMFASVSGSGTANAATMGRVALPEMKKYNYNDKLAAGAVAAGGTLGPLIPPSTIFILYGILTQQSIGKLFIAGILPGLLKVFLYMIVINVICKRHPDWGPRAPEKASVKERISSIRYIWSILFLFVLVIGGLYTGIFTPTEAAGIGAFGALICAILKEGRKFSFKKFLDSGTETSRTYGNTFLILVGAMVIGTFLSVTRLPFFLADYIGTLAVSRYVIISILIAIFLLLGCIMDILSVVVIVVPIVFPIVTAIGFDPIWFGVLVCWLFEIGALTPPVGINVFVLKNVAPEVELSDIFAGVAPFYIVDTLAIILLVAFPQISTYLPKLMMG